MLQERARRREREGPAGADREDALLGRDQVAGPRDEERALLVGHDQQRLELAQHLVGAPVLGELDRGALEVAAVLVELRLEAGEERERVGRRAGESRNDLAALQAADLRRRLLHDRVAQRDLAVRGHRHRARRGARRRPWSNATSPSTRRIQQPPRRPHRDAAAGAAGGLGPERLQPRLDDGLLLARAGRPGGPRRPRPARSRGPRSSFRPGSRSLRARATAPSRPESRAGLAPPLAIPDVVSPTSGPIPCARNFSASASPADAVPELIRSTTGSGL